MVKNYNTDSTLLRHPVYLCSLVSEQNLRLAWGIKPRTSNLSESVQANSPKTDHPPS